MDNDVKKKINASAIILTLAMVVFLPTMNSNIGTHATQTPPKSLDGWNPGWLYRKLLTINTTMISGTLVNFPILVQLTDSDLAAHAQPTGNDILFMLYSDNTTKLNHEIEYYNSNTGTLDAWVNITRLSSTTNTKIWMYYGNANSGNQQNKYGTWNSKYKAVYHLDENAPPYADSTCNKNNITTATVNGTGMSQPGGIYRWQHFNGTSNRFVLPFSLSGAYTLEAIANTDSVASSEVMVGYGLTSSSPDPGVAMGISAVSNAILIGNSNCQKALSPTATYVTAHTTHWWSDEYVSNTSLRFYLDGTNDTSSLFNVNYFNDATGYDTIGARYYSGSYSLFWKGFIDEVRISNGTWNASWMTTCYNNQNNPESFISIGAEESYEYTLTLIVDPTAGGTIAASPAPPYSYNEVVTLTATPNPGYSFSQWTGDLTGNQNPATLTMNGNKTVTAHFSQIVYTLTITIDPVAGGSVSAVPSPPYYYGNVVTLTATANPGYTFDHWSGDASGSSPVTTVMMNGNKAVTAWFIFENMPPVAVNDSATVLENSTNNSINVLANDHDPDGDNLTITAVTQPSHGVSSHDSSFVYYTPLASYTGPDSFTYNISDGYGGNASATVFITVIPVNKPPYVPNNPSPANGTANVSITTHLGWSGGDPDHNDSVLYDVYFGTNSTPPLVSSNQSTSTYNPGTLAYKTTYNWRIVSRDTHNATAKGPVWHFTTQNEQKIAVNITRPMNHSFYLRNIRLFSLPKATVVFGPITITAKVTADAGVKLVEFYIDGKLKKTETKAPFTYRWAPLKSFKHVILVRAFDMNNHMATAQLTVFKWRLHPLAFLALFYA